MRSGCGSSRTCVLRAAILLTLLPGLLAAEPFNARRILEPNPVVDWFALRMRNKIFHRIDLSEGQLDRIRWTLDGHRPLLLDEAEELELAWTEMMDRVRAESFDTEALRAAHARASAAELELALHTAQVLREVREILTPEQRAEATVIVAEIEEGADLRYADLRERFSKGELFTPRKR